MIKLFYSPPQWKAFVSPEKPDRSLFVWWPNYQRELEQYEKAYAEAKANALEVGNPEVIRSVRNINNVPILQIEAVHGVDVDWKGSAVIKDENYILSI